MLGKRGEAEVHRARREEGFVRPRKGQDVANFASDESLSIVTRSGGGEISGKNGSDVLYISATPDWVVRIRDILIGY
jgi:hypothetical protein